MRRGVLREGRGDERYDAGDRRGGVGEITHARAFAPLFPPYCTSSLIPHMHMHMNCMFGCYISIFGGNAVHVHVHV